jgi:hypothetical protein
MKKIFAKALSLLLIIFGLYHIGLSIISIFIIYPRLPNSPEGTSWLVQESLVEKAIILYLSTIIDGLYGLSLLIRPVDEIKTIHFLAGAVLFVFSLFFITRTRLTADPVLFYLFEILESH